MKIHNPASEEPEELAERYVSGAMDAEERTAFEAHLDQGCAPCLAVVRRLSEVAEAMWLTLPAVEPSAGALDRLFERIGHKPSPTGREVEGIDRGTGQLDWQFRAKWLPLGPPGVMVRTLYLQESPPRHWTALIAMKPGSRVPSHAHGGGEELYLIEGRLRVSETWLGAGDFHYTPPGGTHADMVTEEGCTALVIRFLDDEEPMPSFIRQGA